MDEHMKLTFLGTGSAFNTSLGNTSAYLQTPATLILLDCGGTVFHRLMQKKILQDLKALHIIITHTHPDHVGSLGEVIFYAHYILKITPVIYFPDAQWLQELLRLLGVEAHMYRVEEKTPCTIGPYRGADAIQLDFIPVTHLPTVPSYGVLLGSGPNLIYYSGDANAVPPEVLEGFLAGHIHTLYQDTSGIDYQGTGHMAIERLCQCIPEQLRHRVVCMHLDGHISEQAIEALGFYVAKEINP